MAAIPGRHHTRSNGMRMNNRPEATFVDIDNHKALLPIEFNQHTIPGPFRWGKFPRIATLRLELLRKLIEICVCA